MDGLPNRPLKIGLITKVQINKTRYNQPIRFDELFYIKMRFY